MIRSGHPCFDLFSPFLQVFDLRLQRGNLPIQFLRGELHKSAGFNMLAFIFHPQFAHFFFDPTKTFHDSCMSFGQEL